MIKNKNLSNILELNIALIFISTSGTLGRYIDLPVPITIGFRAMIAGILIFLFCKWKGLDFSIRKQDRGMILLSGVLMGLHWITYFYALKLSTVAIGMISLFTFPVITALLEPLLLKKRFEKMQFVLGSTTLVGVYFLVPEFNLKNDYLIAIILGIVSAIFYSLRIIITKPKVTSYNGSIIMMYQLAVIAVCLFPFYFFYNDVDMLGQLPASLTLALLTTAIGHTLFLHSLKNFSATSASIMSTSQLIYGILIGAIFLSEIPSSGSMIGGLVILGSVLMESMRTYKKPILSFSFKRS